MALPKTFVISRPTLVAIEQWFCFLLGIVCMASGVWGICMSYREDLLGSAVVPALRVTAAACLGMGVALVRLGSAKTLPKSELPDLKLTNNPADLKRIREPAHLSVTPPQDFNTTHQNRALQMKAGGNEDERFKYASHCGEP